MSEDDDHRPKTLVVTSSVRDEGKTTVAVSLALTLADAGQLVCLVDADLHRSRIGSIFDCNESVGLSSVIDGTAVLADAIQPWQDSWLSVLPAGPIPAHPSELIASDEARHLMETLEREFDFVVIDTPAVLGAADASSIAGQRGAVILVVAERARASVTTDQLATSLESLDEAGAELWGVVLNRQGSRSGSGSAHVVYD